uniref:Uncharacterized protein n=1 Tax=Chromera velia CCMP2878 TaxID=1169474 RepID=A0A0G4FMB4_9ALVE|eukprot:Cvel_17566.t1-p1 / transcript=Cvel_17566.t1 / gene=Cvel_17566 / organism=Chromera_velia_CCMP2878 / gene_product=hypothetical protein / transcript_product=hypothetical protein / location=Cvel_scaffold1411:24728-34375(+) / protein_length=343 / sequence_SO=supercontig / SO=protein_coding / is_pseudo=false
MLGEERGGETGLFHPSPFDVRRGEDRGGEEGRAKKRRGEARRSCLIPAPSIAREQKRGKKGSFHFSPSRPLQWYAYPSPYDGGYAGSVVSPVASVTVQQPAVATPYTYPTWYAYPSPYDGGYAGSVVSPVAPVTVQQPAVATPYAYPTPQMPMTGMGMGMSGGNPMQTTMLQHQLQQKEVLVQQLQSQLEMQRMSTAMMTGNMANRGMGMGMGGMGYRNMPQKKCCVGGGYDPMYGGYNQQTGMGMGMNSYDNMGMNGNMGLNNYNGGMMNGGNMGNQGMGYRNMPQKRCCVGGGYDSMYGGQYNQQAGTYDGTMDGGNMTINDGGMTNVNTNTGYKRGLGAS